MAEQAEAFFTKHLGKILIGLFFLAIVAIVAASWGYFGYLKIRPTIGVAEFGQMADFFGGALGPILGFFSFMGLLVALYVQGAELKLSREELRLSREELAKSAGALDSQNSTIERQRFEQTFFSWLNTYRQLVDDACIEYSSLGGLVSETGKKGLSELAALLRRSIKQAFEKRLNLNCFDQATIKQECHPQAARIIMSQWEALYQSYESQLGGAFRVLYGLIRWVDQNKLAPNEKWLYVSIIRAQLSSDELNALFFNGITEKGRKFRALANKYALFDNFDMSKDQYANILKQSLSEDNGYEISAFSSEEAKRKYHTTE